MVWTAVHEVEGDIERIDITVVAVVDQRTSVLSYLHLQSHCHRFELCHALVDIFSRKTEFRCHDGRDDGILYRCIVDERDRETVFHTFIYIGNHAHALLLLDVLHIERSLRILERPAEFLALIVGIFGYHLVDNLVIAIIDYGLCIMEEDEFLPAFLLHGREVFLMRSTQIGQYGDGWLDDVTQGKHFAWHTDTCLENAHLGLLVHQPYRQWHTYLRVVTARTAGNKHAWREQLVKPLLDHGLAV